MSSSPVNEELDHLILGREERDERCGCGLAAIQAYRALLEIERAATTGGVGVETFDQFPDWLQRHKESFRKDLEEFQDACRADIGPGSPLTPIIFQLDGLDGFAIDRGRFETQIRVRQMLESLFEALEECL